MIVCRRSFIALAAAGIVPAAAQEASLAKQMTIVVAAAPGGSNDVFARLIAGKLAPRLGITIIVENKPGANGAIGAQQVARAAPNGAALLMISSSFATNAAVQASLPYDPIGGFVPIAQLASGPMLLTVAPGAPYKSLADLLAFAKANAGKINYGTSGVGSINHMVTELMTTMSGVELTHVPYKGMANAVTDLMSGEIQMIIGSFPSLGGQLKAGRVRGLAVTTKERSAFAPDLPAIADAVPGYATDLWWGLLAPAGMPPELAQRLNTEIRAIVAEPDMRDRFAAEGAAPASISAADFATLLRSEIETWRKIAKDRKISIE